VLGNLLLLLKQSLVKPTLENLLKLFELVTCDGSEDLTDHLIEVFNEHFIRELLCLQEILDDFALWQNRQCYCACSIKRQRALAHELDLRLNWPLCLGLALLIGFYISGNLGRNLTLTK
jgi:hypothetical protein